MYCSISLVRELSGLYNETNISDSLIRGKINIATSILDGAMQEQYVLPLVKRRNNSLAFSGTGTGSGTMAIVINGTTYNIPIALGLTAKAAADLFRDSTASSSDFFVDDFYSIESVIITSKTNDNSTKSNSEVNITSATTTQGISAATGRRDDSYPSAVEQLAAEGATALLFLDSYGIEAGNSQESGGKRWEQFLQKVRMIQNKGEDGGMDIRDDFTKQRLTVSQKSLASGFPDDTNEPLVSISEEF